MSPPCEMWNTLQVKSDSVLVLFILNTWWLGSARREALAEPQQGENPGDCSKWLFCLFFVEKPLLRSYVCRVEGLDPEPLVQQKE